MGGSSPARTRHSTTAQSPPDCSPASLSSVLVPLPWVTVRPAPGPERTGSLRAMLSSLIGNGPPWNDPVPRASTAAHDRVIASVNRPRAGPAPITTGEPEPTRIACGQLPHAAKTLQRCRSGDTPRGPITRPDRPDLSAVRSSLLPDEPAREIFMAMQGDHAS